MSGFDWSNHYTRLIALDSSNDYSQQEIANILSEETGEDISRDMVRHALERAKEIYKSLSDTPKPDRIPFVTKYYEYLTGDKTPEKKDTGARERVLRKAEAKILVHSDLHIPFHDEAMVSDSINKNMDADAYIGVADIMDVYAHSLFEKDTDMPFIFEVDETLRFLEYLSNTFPCVLLLEANHEARVKKTLQRMLPTSLHFLVESNVLERLAAPFPNIIVYNDIWFFQFGSAIFSHPEKASQVELRAAISVYEHFKEWDTMYSLSPWNCLLVAHTHQQGVAYPAHAKVIEMGCLSKPMGYAFNPKIKYKHPHSNGYVVLHMEHGVCDLNRCREYRFVDQRKYL